MPAIPNIRKNSNLFVPLLLLIFFGLGLLGILNHSMWRDELNVWLIVRDSQSWSEFFANVKYEGHPGLWYLCLWLLHNFTDNPLIMQLFHLTIAIGVIYLFIRYSPFTPLQKILFSFGYLPFYEYAIISRNYSLNLLFMFAFCALFPNRTKTYIWLAFCLALMANSNAYGLLISIALFLTLKLEYISQLLFKFKTKVSHPSLANIGFSVLIYSLGLLTSLALMIPPADSRLSGGLVGWNFNLEYPALVRTLTRIWNSYILILVPGDSKLLDVTIFALISLGMIGFVALIFLKKPSALGFYLFGTIELLLFTYTKFLGSPRHYGHLYLILIVTLWLSHHYQKSEYLYQKLIKINPHWQNWWAWAQKWQIYFVMLILSCQFVAGIVAYTRNLTIPYSASRATADYILKHHLEEKFMVGSQDVVMAPLCGYLNRKIYYPESKTLGSFVLFNPKRQDLPVTEVLEEVLRLMEGGQTEILLILNYPLETKREGLEIKPLEQFTRGLIVNEKYYLYQVKLRIVKP